MDESARVVLGGAAIGGWINSDLRLRERLDGKAAKYDLYGKPFAIVVGVRDSTCDLSEVYHALVGAEEIVVATLQSRIKGDGFFGMWGHRGGGKHQRVSAVFSVHEWYPGGPYRPRIARFGNPLAEAPFPDDGLPYGGRWGVTERGATHIRADWQVQPVPPILARDL